MPPRTDEAFDCVLWRGAWSGGREPWQREFDHEDLPLSNLFVTMLQRLGVQAESFSDSTGTLDVV